VEVLLEAPAEVGLVELDQLAQLEFFVVGVEAVAVMGHKNMVLLDLVMLEVGGQYLLVAAVAAAVMVGFYLQLLLEVQDFLKVVVLVHETTMDLLAVGAREF
jgi:hypothetical protein